MHNMISLNEQQIQEFLQGQNSELSGYYNKNYKIKYNGIPYILRIPIENATSMDMRFIAEENILDFINDGNFNINVPRVEMNETYNGQKYFLHNFISGDTIEEIYPESERMPDWIVDTIARIMTRLHNIPLKKLDAFSSRMPWKISASDFYNYIYEYNKGLIEKYQKDYKPIFDFLGMPNDINCFIKNRKHEIEDAPFVLAHSDIHRKNVIINETVQSAVVIDWELALIAPSFYDISIHLHKMRYEKEQEDLFLNTICTLSGTDNDFARKQIELYRDIEEVKSVAIDIVRYLSIINETSEEQTISNAKRYFTKLMKAYICWGKDFGTLNAKEMISFFIEKRKNNIQKI